MRCLTRARPMATVITRKTRSRKAGSVNFLSRNVFSFFFRNRREPVRPLQADMHSHLLPGIDDGVKTNEESFAIIDQMLEMGYQKIITTPHIMTDYYGNTAATLEACYKNFLPALRAKGYTLPFEFAAEYYLDEKVYEAAVAKDIFLTFGD